MSKYEHVVEYLRKHGLSSLVMHKTWAKRPPFLSEDDELIWFKNELISRGYVAEYIIVEIPPLES